MNFTSRLILIDTHALMFRFHHSYGKLLQSETGEKTSISYGVMKTLLDLLETVNPPLTHLAVIMDAPGKNFRCSPLGVRAPGSAEICSLHCRIRFLSPKGDFRDYRHLQQV